MSLSSDKLFWVNPDAEKRELIRSRLNSMLSDGETLLVIGKTDEDDLGITEEEIDESLKTLDSFKKDADIECKVVQRLKCDNNTFAARVLVRKFMDNQDDFLEIRVAVVGNVDSGKSTLLGVLTHDMLDNGRGLARLKLFRHKHEIESGRTSSVGMEILGFDSSGNIVKPSGHSRTHHNANWSSICEGASKVINFLDLAGHEKYLKTTVYGLTGYLADYSMLMIGANMGLVGMTKEHLGLSMALEMPVFAVITKIDICPPNVLARTMKTLTKILKLKECKKIAYVVNDESDAIICAAQFVNERLCPVFQISNVTGQNIDLLKTFLNLLPIKHVGDVTAPPEFQIDDIFNVLGIGTVVSGIMFNGVIKSGDSALLGPDRVGEYTQIQIKSIHRKRMPVEFCKAGQTASFAIKKSKNVQLRRGMMVITKPEMAVSHRYFEANVEILHHPTTIKVNYQAVVHVAAVKQSVQIIGMSVPLLRNRDRATVTFKFIKHGEYLKVGQRLIFREGRTKAIGTITHVFCHFNECLNVSAGFLDTPNNDPNQINPPPHATSSTDHHSARPRRHHKRRAKPRGPGRLADMDNQSQKTQE